MRKFLRLLALFASMSLYAADAAKAPRTDVWAELTYCGTEQEMFGTVYKFKMKLSGNFPLEHVKLVVGWGSGSSVCPLSEMGNVFRLGYSSLILCHPAPGRPERLMVNQVGFFGGPPLCRGTIHQLENRDGKFPKLSFLYRTVLYPGADAATALCTWKWTSPEAGNKYDLSAIQRFTPWKMPPRHGLFLQLVIPAEELAKVEAGTPYHVMLRNRTLERLGFPPDKVRDGWNLEELDRKVAELAEYRLRFDTGAAGLPEVLVREIAVLRALLGQPGVAASPQAKELCRAYETRLVKQLDLFKLMYEAGNIPLEALKSKEHELNEFRAKYAADAAQPTQTDARLAKYRAAAEKGDAASQFELGCRLGFGWGADGDNRREAEKWFRKSAAQGHITARGACLLFGFGVGKNPEEAEKLFRGEAEKGDAWAQLLLGRCRLGKRDVKDAVGWFRKSALQGNAVAQFKLAERYHFGGWGIAKDPAEADKWLKKSAKQGHTPAIIALESLEYMKHPPRNFSVKHGGIDVDKIKAMDLAELKKYQKTVEEKYRAGEVGIEELNLIQSRIIELMHPQL